MPPILFGQAALLVFFCSLYLFSHGFQFQRLSLYALVILAEDGKDVEAGHTDDAGNHQEGLLIANLVMKCPQGSGKDNLPNLGCNLKEGPPDAQASKEEHYL